MEYDNTNLKAVISYYVLTLDGGIFNHFGTQKERNLGLEKVTFSGKSLSPILKLAMRGRPMFMLKTVYKQFLPGIFPNTKRPDLKSF